MAALTPTRIHHETGVSRATIYRNWPEPTDLVAALLDRAARRQPPPKASVRPAEDLAELMVDAAQRLADPELGALLLAGTESARRSAQAAASTQSLLTALFAPLAAVLGSAVETRLVVGDQAELLADLVGPLLADQLVIGRDPAPERARELADRFLSSHAPDALVGHGANSHTVNAGPANSTVQSMS